jgi:hypothetical protein
MISGEVLKYQNGFLLILQGYPPCPDVSRPGSADITVAGASARIYVGAGVVGLIALIFVVRLIAKNRAGP